LKNVDEQPDKETACQEFIYASNECILLIRKDVSAQPPTDTAVTGVNSPVRWQVGTGISPTPCPHRQPCGLPPAGRKTDTMPAKRTAFLLRSVRRGRTACSVGKHINLIHVNDDHTGAGNSTSKEK